MSVEDGDVLQAVVDFLTPGGNHMQNKYTWLASLASSQSEAAVITAILAALDILYTEMNADISTVFNDPDCYIDKIAVVGDQWEVSENVGEGIIDTSFASTDEIVPFQCAPYFCGRTARPRSRGRKFILPFGEDRSSGSGLIAGAVTDLTDAATEYIDDIDLGSGNTLIPGIASTVTLTFWPFVGAIVANLIGSQRRRVPGVGF